MLKLIHADNFYSEDSAKQIFFAINNANFVDKEYGQEIDNFQLIEPDIDKVFSSILGHEIVLDQTTSGVFRKPILNIHFESFAKINEWCLAVALEPTTFNVYHHIDHTKPYDNESLKPQIDSRNVLEGYQFNYRNIFEWTVCTNVLLERNQCLFYRPWIFHSFDGGLIHYFKMSVK